MELPLTLKGRVAVVTGGSRGIGWAISQILAEYGCTVILTGHSKPELVKNQAAKLKECFGVDAEGLICDVTDPTAVRDCYSSIHRIHKKLDILVNNAGILEDNLLGMVDEKNYRKTFDVNVLGVLLNMQYAARLMGRTKSGSIINISSIIGRVGNSGQVVYGGSKAAVIGMTLSAAKELAASNIRVNAIAPGFIDTDMVRQLLPEKHQARMQSIKMGRIGSPEEVAKAVLFFASDLSSYVTGQVLGVDGGMLI